MASAEGFCLGDDASLAVSSCLTDSTTAPAYEDDPLKKAMTEAHVFGSSEDGSEYGISNSDGNHTGEDADHGSGNLYDENVTGLAGHANQGDLFLSMAQADYVDDHVIRKSARKRKPRPLSPDNDLLMSKKRKRPRKNPNPGKSAGRRGSFDTETESFCCDLCKSPYVTNPTRRGNKPKLTNANPSPRHKIDPSTGRMLTLCNACGLAFNRPKRPRKERPLPNEVEKAKYLQEAQQFALSLAEGLSDPEAERLFCPHFKLKACGCMQNFIIGEGNMEESRRRANQLLRMLKEAKQLSQLKCYEVVGDPTNPSGQPRSKRARNIGLGNGQRKSQAFEDFVLKNRKILREQIKLCERATQKVLCYSNNFLHKKLKTDPQKGVRKERQKGKEALGQLRSIEDLPRSRCCVDNCVLMALTHGRLLQQWRDRARSGQIEARRVLAEMLTPSGGARSNCYKFINWVTGCSHSTIGRVNDQMKRTGGDREPPQHGLKKWWKEHPKKKKKEELSGVATTGSETVTITIPATQIPNNFSHLPPNAQINIQQQQIQQLQRQLAQQQLHMTQGQVLQPQFLHPSGQLVSQPLQLQVQVANVGSQVPQQSTVLQNSAAEQVLIATDSLGQQLQNQAIQLQQPQLTGTSLPLVNTQPQPTAASGNLLNTAQLTSYNFTQAPNVNIATVHQTTAGTSQAPTQLIIQTLPTPLQTQTLQSQNILQQLTPQQVALIIQQALTPQTAATATGLTIGSVALPTQSTDSPFETSSVDETLTDGEQSADLMSQSNQQTTLDVSSLNQSRTANINQSQVSLVPSTSQSQATNQLNLSQQADQSEQPSEMVSDAASQSQAVTVEQISSLGNHQLPQQWLLGDKTQGLVGVAATGNSEPSDSFLSVDTFQLLTQNQIGNLNNIT
ncbi:uncharacterized protein LOC144879003 isoform X1 [Branchiostoma floridae x Branchiostoma japonicum]